MFTTRRLLQRAWITLQEKSMDYEWKEVNPYKKDKEYLAINPKGLVPSVVYHGKNLYESQVIVEFLEDIGGADKSLFPKDPFDRAIARLWIQHISTKICPAFFKVMQAQVIKFSVAVLPAPRTCIEDLHSKGMRLVCTASTCLYGGWDMPQTSNTKSMSEIKLEYRRKTSRNRHRRSCCNLLSNS